MNNKDINGKKIISVILNSVTSYQNITYFNYWEKGSPLSCNNYTLMKK